MFYSFMDVALKETAKYDQYDANNDILAALTRFDLTLSPSCSSSNKSHTKSTKKKDNSVSKPTDDNTSSGNMNNDQGQTSKEANNAESKKSALKKKIANFFKYHHTHNHYQDLFKHLDDENSSNNYSKDDNAITKAKTSTSLSIKRQRMRSKSLSLDTDNQHSKFNHHMQTETVEKTHRTEKLRSISEFRPPFKHSMSVNDDNLQRERKTSFHSDVLVFEFDKKEKLELNLPFCHMEKLKDIEEVNDNPDKELEIIEECNIEEPRNEDKIDDTKKDDDAKEEDDTKKDDDAKEDDDTKKDDNDEDDNEEKDDKNYKTFLNIKIDKGSFHTKKVPYKHSLSWSPNHQKNDEEEEEDETVKDEDIKITKFSGDFDIEIIHGNQIVKKNNIILKSVLKKSKSFPEQKKDDVQNLIDEALFSHG